MNNRIAGVPVEMNGALQNTAQNFLIQRVLFFRKTTDFLSTWEYRIRDFHDP
jgi:hypothetical protein